MAMISEHRSDVLEGAGGVIYYVENAIAMLNKQYFHYGVKRAYEEWYLRGDVFQLAE